MNSQENTQHNNEMKVGNVTLDLTYYPGEDFYSDGAIEDEMLEIAMNNSVDDFAGIIEQKKSWPIFYHLSPFRTNIIDWLPIKKTDKILEIGSGCGAITGSLANKAGSVTCIDLSKKRSLVNAYRNKDFDNITIKVGNFKDIEPHLDKDYDYVLLIGVFEYGQAYIGGNTPYEDFMRICNAHKKLDGRMIIAIENKFGLKYWAGCREDHLGTYFSGLEGYREGGAARTFTKKGLEKILANVGISEYSFYYPYPDYKFMTTIYSDKYLPKKGELCNNLRNFDRERILLFDEKQVFDQIIEENEFPLFSNSYLLVVGGAPNVIYAKFSNDRAKSVAIQTAIVRDAPGRIHVEKIPDSPVACGHLKNTMRAYQLLSKRYEGTKIKINKCKAIDRDMNRGVAFEFCNGVTLESLLDDCLTQGDTHKFRALVDEYLMWLKYNENNVCVSNLDFIFPNILVDGDCWHVIDYEWTFAKKIPANEIAFRAFYNYTLGGETRKASEQLLMKEILGLSDIEIEQAAQEERMFQNHINANHASVNHMRELIGNRAYEIDGMLTYCAYADSKFVAKIYLDYGEGFSEEQSVTFKDCYFAEKDLRIQYDIPQNVTRVRIDPCSYMCTISIRKIVIDDKIYTQQDIETNGVWQSCGCIVFDNEDPNMTIQTEGGTRLEVDMEVMELPEILAKQLTSTVNDKNVVSKAKDLIKKADKRRR